MSDERKPLPETGFRCYPAKPESITCNMVILVDDMIKWLQDEKASGQNITQNGQGKGVVRLTMLATKKEDAKVSHFFTYDDRDSQKQSGYQQSNNVTRMEPVLESDIPF